MEAVKELNLKELKESLKHVSLDQWHLPTELERKAFHPSVIEYVEQSKPVAILQLIKKYEAALTLIQLLEGGLKLEAIEKVLDIQGNL